MTWLNYHHLLYFWTVARHGSITKAAEELRLAQPTISGQLRTLEEALGEKLLTKSGRGLALTDAGQVAYRYADEIFSLGRELLDSLEGRPTGKPLKLRVGITDVMPKLISHRLLEPVLKLDQEVRLVCHEDKTERLLADMAVQGLDLVLADAPLGGAAPVRAFNHQLGECGVSFFAARKLHKRYSTGFPACLDGAPMLLPRDGTLLRRSLGHWFVKNDIRPSVVAEFDDSALMKVFGEHGSGVFPAPSIVEDEIRETYKVRVVGRADEVKERFFAITLERRIQHPAAIAISEYAREQLFG